MDRQGSSLGNGVGCACNWDLGGARADGCKVGHISGNVNRSSRGGVVVRIGVGGGHKGGEGDSGVHFDCWANYVGIK
jgi:hypothetical protein